VTLQEKSDMNVAPCSLPQPGSSERSRRLSIDSLRRRALERLYERRDAVDELIGCLERYEEAKSGKRAPVVEISAAVKLLSGCAR
jgi:hypothetical protein